MKDLKFLKDSLIAHRGVHIDAPENTINAFKEAVKKKYIIEFDVHLLKDNTVVVFHDDNLKRMTGQNKKLKDCTYEEIKDLQLLDSNDYIPTLKEVLKIINGKVPIIVELKSDRKVRLLEKELVKQLDKYKGKFCVKSFNPLSIRWFRKNKPDYIRGLLVNNKKKSLISAICRSNISLIITRPDFISCNYKLHNNKKILRYMKKHPVIAWTIKNEEQLLKNKNNFYNLIVDFYEEKEL